MRSVATASFMLVCLLTAVRAAEPQVPPDEELVGLWGAESWFGPQVRGEITLQRHADRWTVAVGGFETSFPIQGDEVRVSLPGGGGELRAHLEDRGNTVRGFWMQPRGNLGRFASPVTLSRVRAGAWRGVVAPLDDRFSLYLLIRRNDYGSLRASFNNPDVNWTGRSPWFRVALAEERVELIDPSTGKLRFAQPYDASQRQIGMDFGAPMGLTPRTRERAVGYYPRSPEATSYRYREPVPRRDGWQTAPAGKVGIDEARLRALVERIASADPAVEDGLRVHSLLVARHGKLVLEEYFYGFTAERAHDLRSASKTFTSLMVGQLLDQDRSLTVDTPIDRIFPRGPDASPRSPVTIGHLLTHSSGLACDDNDDASSGNEDLMQGQQEQTDWYRYFLDLPVVHEPGAVYAYCSGGINLAAGIVAKTTDTWLPDWFDRHVARPLQMEGYFVNLMPDGQAYGGGGIYMRPRDFLKLGQTYLAGGVWNGARIVSQAWVKTSTAHRIRTSGGDSDGYGWHRHTLRAQGRDFEEYEASGNGGQFVIVVPALDLAIAITAGNYNQYAVWRKLREELVPKYILSAVVGD